MKEKVFNSLHYIIGFAIGLCLNYSFKGLNLIPQLFIGFIVLGALGFFYEAFGKVFYKSKFDYKDIVRGIIGGLLAILIL